MSSSVMLSQDMGQSEFTGSQIVDRNVLIADKYSTNKEKVRNLRFSYAICQRIIPGPCLQGKRERGGRPDVYGVPSQGGSVTGYLLMEGLTQGSTSWRA